MAKNESADVDPFEGNDPFDDPGTASQYPTMKQLKGRLLIVQPTKLEKGLPNKLQPGQTRDRMTATVHVIDGDTITARIDDDDNATPLDEPLVPPFKLEDMFLSGAKIISETKGKLPSGDKPGGMVIGRLTKLKPLNPGQKGAWSLETATPEDKVAGRKYLASLDVFS